ncbi:radical SAM family heme chaperone HemW [Oceaniglobus ichthyenteri]|uniref:radical SAM family heme chaperone HemW n=1 Tax=Oceaniglobus ichthyenteri TaxID=2136177 RepID=UPI001F0CD968|nr:radical SAM family heme chaperone HemW [Oceaniglobus ichthyenteri]
MPDITPEGGFGLYVHWPFCQAKCPYCDFNSHVVARVDHGRWRDALVSEIKRYGEMAPNRVLNTIFFGGGTPSLMVPETVAAVIETARAIWPGSNDMEITLEANPTSVEAGRFQAYREAGINRISMGIQALNDKDLRRLGRLHSVRDAKAAFDIAQSTFDRVSFDLIYARQDQSLAEWKAELSEALSMAIDHLSLYQLSIEDGTAFGDRYNRGKLRGLPNDDLSADMYDLTQDLCGAAGLSAYEVSNHAKTGSESRHNLIYWRYGDYVGVGPGAHGRLTLGGQKYATEAVKQPGAWLNAVESADGTTDSATALSGNEQAAEYLMMGLRLSDGVSMQRFHTLAETPLYPQKLAELQALSVIALEDDRLRVTPTGRPILNEVLRQLLT